MTSLLERMNIDNPAGPTRTGKKSDRASPYPRPLPPKGDSNSKWQHDQFSGSLGDRISGAGGRPRAGPRKLQVDSSAVASALNRATSGSGGGGGNGGGDLHIKGAGSTAHNIIEIRGLVAGTTVDDVKAIFAQVGTISSAGVGNNNKKDDPVVRITYKDAAHAAEAVKKYNGQNADGRKLVVQTVGVTSTTLSARMGAVVRDGKVDDILGGSSDFSGKLRSDEILATDRRASVQTTPAGQNPTDYTPSRGGGRGGQGRGGRGPRDRNGRGRRGRGGKKEGGGMDVDA